MKLKAFVCALALTLISATAMAADVQTEVIKPISLSSKVPFTFYGFVSAEAMWADSQLSSFGTNNNTPASYNRNMSGFNRVVDETVDGRNDAFISATPQNTRFGFALAPYDFGGKDFSVDARLEMDFFSTGNMSVHSIVPRIRRAYVGIGQKCWRFIAGQEWDLFSPLNTATLNIGGNMWRQGNLGFRRPQMRFTYSHDFTEATGIEVAASVNLPSNAMNFDDSGNATGVPMLEGRVGVSHKLPAGKFWAYVSGVYARHENAVAGQSDVNNWGIAASLAVPAHKFLKFQGEFQYGYSLGLLLANSSDSNRQRTIAGWGQIESNWLKWFETNVGWGIDMVKASQVANGWVKNNQVAFFNVQFKPIEQFIIGLEYNYLRTNYKGSGASSANAAFTNILFYF